MVNNQLTIVYLKQNYICLSSVKQLINDCKIMIKCQLSNKSIYYALRTECITLLDQGLYKVTCQSIVYFIQQTIYCTPLYRLIKTFTLHKLLYWKDFVAGSLICLLLRPLKIRSECQLIISNLNIICYYKTPFMNSRFPSLHCERNTGAIRKKTYFFSNP